MDPHHDDARPLPARLKTAAWATVRSLGGVMIGVAALLALIGVGHRIAVRWNRTPAERARVLRELTEKIRVPDEWLNPKPWSAELLAASDEFAEACEQWSIATPVDPAFSAWFGSDQSIGKPLSEAEAELVAAMLAGSDEIAHALRRAVATPDYDIAALKDRRDGVDLPGWRPDERHPIRASYNGAVLPLFASLAASRGETEAGFGAALLAARLGGRHECSGIFEQSYGMWTARRGCESIALVGRTANGAEHIAATLAALEAEEPIFAMRSIQRFGFDLDVFGGLREHRRHGFPPSIATEETMAYYRFLSLDCASGYAPWRVAQLHPSHPEAMALDPYGFHRRAGVDRGVLDTLENNKMMRLLPGFRRTIEEQALFMLQPFPATAAIRVERYTLAVYHLTRLALARRIAELDPAARPAILDDPPADPFDPGGAKLRWSEELGAHYSIGPDGRDDGAKTIVGEAGIAEAKPGDVVLRAYWPSDWAAGSDGRVAMADPSKAAPAEPKTLAESAPAGSFEPSAEAAR